MSFLSRLLRTGPDPREALRPLWHSVVAHAREPEWYADCGVADSVEGRFDMITLVLVLVMLRMEQDDDLRADTALLTELFVEDIEGQLREQGVGDPVVGKHMGRLMSTLGGRMAAYRKGMAERGPVLEDALRRNVALIDENKLPEIAARAKSLADRLERTGTEALRKGELAQ